MVISTKAAAALFTYFSFLKGTVVASLSISHQMPRWLYGNCSSISVSNGPGHVQTLIKIWLKYPLLFVRRSQAPALRWTLHYVCAVCFEMSLLFVKLIVHHSKPQPHSNLCWRRSAFSWLSIIHLSSYIDWWLMRVNENGVCFHLKCSLLKTSMKYEAPVVDWGCILFSYTSAF